MESPQKLLKMHCVLTSIIQKFLNIIAHQHTYWTPGIILLCLKSELLKGGVGVEVYHHGRLLAGVRLHFHPSAHVHRAALVGEDGELRACHEVVSAK